MKLITLFILIIIYTNSYSQVTEEWVQRYNDSKNFNDRATSIAIDDNGNVYITGHSTNNTSSGPCATIKYNTSGIQQWIAYSNALLGYSIAVDGSGNVYVTGISGEILTKKNYKTVKYNSDGIEQWIQTYNGPVNEDDEAHSIAIDFSGNVYVTGWTTVESFSNKRKCTTIKYDSDGVLQWVAIYEGTINSSTEGWYISVDASNNVYVTGHSLDFGTNNNYLTIKYSSNGTEIWAQSYNGQANNDDRAHFHAVDDLGNVYVTGQSYGNGSSYDYVTIKYSPTGIQQWIQKYITSGVDVAKSIGVDDFGNIYVTGGSYGGLTGSDYATIKYNSSGVQQWIQRYNNYTKYNDFANSLVLDHLGNIYVSGYSSGNGTNFDYVTIKYSSTGVQQWIQRYNGPGNNVDKANSLAVDASGNVYVTGESIGNEKDYDYATIKYSQQVGIVSLSTAIPDNYNLYQNYPNPFNPNSKIKFALPKNSFVKIIIYDLLGKEIETIVNGQLSAGVYETYFDGTGLSTGVYFYRLTTEDYSETKNMMLIK